MTLNTGSSPQARGTRWWATGKEARSRFIPAGAGNTFTLKHFVSSMSVHPRRRGEHASPEATATCTRGSSPQARGTRPGPAAAAGRNRFIPAGAGNTDAWSIFMRRTSVHPRRRGEHDTDKRLMRISGGSSPQARGTQIADLAGYTPDRFIPAGAGNTPRPRTSVSSSAVHPRRRGEHGKIVGINRTVPGSSPQARGTRFLRLLALGVARFIPAGAGNTFGDRQDIHQLSVHPRRRGEHPGGSGLPGDQDGSSPQARGTLMTRHGMRLHRRFIPAGAGNTSLIEASASGSSVHPRRRGEHAWLLLSGMTISGSSPQARGTPSRVCEARLSHRFIPAGAGNTTPPRCSPRGPAVHPRRRGEHISAGRRRSWMAGSSPQARGTLDGVVLLAIGDRFIPAGAGNTQDAAALASSIAVHPRRRGEHAATLADIAPIDGSSPQARGTHREGVAVEAKNRFIPAGAGNTLSTCET